MIRKGQHLFNEIAKTHNLQNVSITRNGQQELYPYVNLHQILYYMSDDEFFKIMQSRWPLLGKPVAFNPQLLAEKKKPQAKLDEIKTKINKIQKYHMKQHDRTESIALKTPYNEFIHDLDDILKTLEEESNG